CEPPPPRSEWPRRDATRWCAWRLRCGPRSSGLGATRHAALDHAPVCGDRPGGTIGLDLDRSVAVRSQHRRARVLQRTNRDLMRVAVPVAGSHADQPRRRMQGCKELRRGPGARTVMADLQDIDWT